MDAFYASVEQHDAPQLQGRPVVVAWKGARSVVCAASYEARRFGVRSAMPALRAERLCPDAVFVPPDFMRYKAVSRQIRDIFSRYTDRIEPLSLDEAYLDVTQPKRDLGSATAIAHEIRAAIFEETQLTASAGIAPNKFLAKIASDWNKPNGQYVIKPHQIDGFLAPLAVGRLPGVGKVMERKLAALGIHTCTDLRQTDATQLEAHFGRWGQRLFELAHGVDTREVQSERPLQQISNEDTFATDLPLEALTPAIQRLALDTWNDYARAWQRRPGRIARTVVLKLKTAEFQTLTRSLTATEPPSSADSLIQTALQLRQRVQLAPTTLYRLVGVGLSGFVDAHEQPIQHALFT